MARGIAIRALGPTSDGRYEVTYSAGNPVAPPGPDGSFTFQSQDDLKEQIQTMADRMTNYDLVLLHLAITWLQSNGGFGNINQVLNKEMRLDTTAPNVLRVV
jgi:hypothetical protein